MMSNSSLIAVCHLQSFDVLMSVNTANAAASGRPEVQSASGDFARNMEQPQ